MRSSVPATTFDSAYENASAPWLIGEPQPAVVALERQGRVDGAILDAGSGGGEHTIHLTRLGYDVLGVDFSGPAVEAARANAAARHVNARFEVADALRLDESGDHRSRYDTIVDSALFHIFGGEEREAYVRSLHAVCRPGATVHVLALSDAGPGVGPQVSEDTIRSAFGAGWLLESVRRSSYRITVTSAHAAQLDLPVGTLTDVPAWLARVRRL